MKPEKILKGNLAAREKGTSAVGHAVDVDDLIAIVKNGGKFRTGVDIYNAVGVLLLGSDIVIDKIKTLVFIKKNGISKIPVNPENRGGIWDQTGMRLQTDNGVQGLQKNAAASPSSAMFPGYTDAVEKRVHEIEQIKIIASEKYTEAKGNIKKVLDTIKATGGEFDYDEVRRNVTDLIDFLSFNDNAFAYLTKEIFTYDDYLYNHSINVCAIGTAVVHRFNANFSQAVNDHLNAANRTTLDDYGVSETHQNSYTCYLKDELKDISIGYFLHDVGKTLVPDSILNKIDALTQDEFTIIRKHSYEYGEIILQKNRIDNPFIANTVRYHHAPLYDGESRCYPDNRTCMEVPPHVKICKLADIYDAMTSKRCYKDAVNPINVVTDIFRKYTRKYQMLQFLIHSFVKSIGIYPPGSIMFLRNGQMAFILESRGPIVIPFTDPQGNTVRKKADPIDIGCPDIPGDLKADNRKSIRTPMDVYSLMPDYLKPAASSLHVPAS